jgi:hypothetical protein
MNGTTITQRVIEVENITVYSVDGEESKDIIEKVLALKNAEGYNTWMQNWVLYNDQVNLYQGYAPDNMLIAEHEDLNEFLKLFKDACNKWSDEEEKQLIEEL